MRQLELVDLLMSARTWEQLLSRAGQVALTCLQGSAAEMLALAGEELEVQCTSGTLSSEADPRREVALEVWESGQVVRREDVLGLPLGQDRVRAAVVVEGVQGEVDPAGRLVASLVRRAVEAWNLRQVSRYVNPVLRRMVSVGEVSTLGEPATCTVTLLALHTESFREEVEVVGPQRLQQVAEQFFRILTDTLYEHEAILLRYGVGGALALFGSPSDTEEASRADFGVAAGLQLVKRFKALAERWGVEGLPVHLDARVGVATGPAMVGLVGPANRPMVGVLGPLVTLAEKLGRQGEPNDVVIDSATRTLLSERAATRSVGAVEVRGLDYPVFSYSVQKILL